MTTATSATQTSGNDSASLNRTVKLWVGLGALATTAVTAGINGYVNVHYAAVQADEAMRKADVRKLEDMIQAFDGLVRVFVVSVKTENVSEPAREAVRNNVQQQYDYLGTLLPLLNTQSQRSDVSEYREQLVEMNKTLRNSADIPTTMRFGQAVSTGVDKRIAAVRALRIAVGLPVEPLKANATQPDNGFGAVED